jgi:hypothetical protein
MNSIAQCQGHLSALRALQVAEVAALGHLRSSLKAAEGDAAAKAAAGGKSAAKAAAKALRLSEESNALVARCAALSAEIAETVARGNAIWATMSMEEKKAHAVPQIYIYGYDDCND